MSDLRGAVIGAGYFSRFHYDAWGRLPDVEIVACCDLEKSKAAAAAAEFGVPRHFGDHRALLAAYDSGDLAIDFVDVVTRPDTHLAICREAAERGLAVICQKPLAPTTPEAHELVAATAGVPFMVHENFRFQPWYREIKRLLDEGHVGDRLHTLSFRNRAGDGHGPDAYLARQPYFQTMERFLLFEAGIHTVDTFRYLAGEVSRVWCSTRKLNPIIAGEDAAMAVFEFEEGGQGLYDANRFNESTAADPRYTFGVVTIEANGGTIRLAEDGRLSIQPLEHAEREHEYDRSTEGFAGDCVFATQQHFLTCLHSGEAFETSGEQYLKTIAVTDALYRSAESGQWERPAALS